MLTFKQSSLLLSKVNKIKDFSFYVITQPISNYDYPYLTNAKFLVYTFLPIQTTLNGTLNTYLSPQSIKQ